MNWNEIILRLRSKGNRYYWRHMFPVALEIFRVANEIEHTVKITEQEDLTKGE